jgi:phosphotransferase system enzyme I (PtsI)
MHEAVYQGIPASPGIIIGQAKLLSRDREKVLAREISDPQREIEQFRRAIRRVKEALEKAVGSVFKRMGPEFARIFEAQALIASDDVWNKNVESRIWNERLCAEFIYSDEAQKVIKSLEQSRDAYLKERIQDIQAVTSRLVGHMRGERPVTLLGLEGPVVVVAHYLSPSDILALSMRKSLGFVTSVGGPTSHTALIAKSLSVTAIIGLGEAAERIASDVRIIIDGYKGVVIVNPSPETLKRYRVVKQSEIRLRRQLAELKLKPAVTKDGFHVGILANIELPNEVPKVLRAGAEGIGLYRTEYLFLTRSDWPSFDEQFQTYSLILRKMKEKPVVIRTFDLGGDKFPGASGRAFEANPFLGWRAIRCCLDRPDIFKTQLKALLKASAWGNLSIMIPMISNYEEIVTTKRMLEECKHELRSENVKFSEKIPIGVMLEVPSAVMIAEHLAREVDFFSMGTNDLIQYALAVDRDNEFISRLYQSFHPSVLSLIKMAVDVAHRHKMKISICGEMAADPLAAVLLVGLGIDELSASFQTTAILKKVVRSIAFSGAKRMAEMALKMRCHSEIEDFLKKEVARVFPEIVPVIQFSRRNSDGGHPSTEGSI